MEVNFTLRNIPDQNIIEMTEDIKEILITFLEQSKTKDLTTGQYPQFYSGLRMKAGFGGGQPAKIFWITFLGKDQEPQNGIFPVYYLFKEHKKLVLAYGISETEKSQSNWLLSPRSATVNKYFNESGFTPYKYGDSFVFEVYDINRELNWEKIEEDLKTILQYYKLLMQTN